MTSSPLRSPGPARAIAAVCIVVSLSLVCGRPARAGAGRAIRALLVACTDYARPDHNTIAASCAEDRRKMTDLLNGFVASKKAEWGIDLDVVDLAGRQVTVDRFWKEFRAMARRTGPDDTVFVFFTGHGAIDDTSRIHHLLACDERFIDRDALARDMAGLSCRLKILLTDCCSQLLRIPVARGLGQPGGDNGYIRKLFLEHRGFCDLTAASEGQFAYGVEDGGRFTVALLFTPGTLRPTWRATFEAAKARVVDLTREEASGVQVPLARSIAEPEESGPNPPPEPGPPPDSGVVSPPADPAPVSYSVVGVSAGKRLRIRSGPGLGFPEVGAIPRDAANIAGTGQAASGWVEVRYGGARGWVSAEYVRAGPSRVNAPVAPPPPPQPPRSGTYRVRGVPAGKRLNVRRDPVKTGRDDNIVDQIPSDGRGLSLLEGPRGEWIRIRYRHANGYTVEGWVSQSFVEPE